MWAAVAPLPPRHVPNPHPLGCHRPRISDRVCFEGILRRLVTGCSWDVAARISGAGETTLRRRRTEWNAAGVFERLRVEALAAYDKVVGLDLSEIAIDGSQHKAPFGGEGTGPNPTDRAKSGWKWSILTDRFGIPLAWAIDGANRNDMALLRPTLEAFAKTTPHKNGTHTLGLRWRVERTNSWFSNFGQLRRDTDRFTSHRLAQIDLAVGLILTVKLIKWADRWSPTNPCPRPVRVRSRPRWGASPSCRGPRPARGAAKWPCRPGSAGDDHPTAREVGPARPSSVVVPTGRRLGRSTDSKLAAEG